MIAAITIMDEETGKIFVKDQPMRPVTTYEDVRDITVTYRWDFKYSFFKDILTESEVKI